MSRDQHGGNVHAAARETGRDLHRLVDFSASINPLGPSRLALQAVRAGLPRTVHYPDPDCVALREALAKRHGLEPDAFLIANGSSELIVLLPRALSLRQALIIGPAYAEYARAVTSGGGVVTRVDASRVDHFRPPIEQACDRMRKVQHRAARIDVVFLCNPNSPTGQVAAVEVVNELVTAAGEHGAWVVVDEAFIEFCEEHSVVPSMSRFPHLLVLRSLTKFYALPGLRAGYVIGPKSVLARIRQQQPPWSVNTLAQAAALAALKDRSHARRSLAYMNRARPRFARMLEALPGVEVFPSAANFLLVELPSPLLASRLARSLRQQGLLVRDCSSVPGLNARMVRLGVRTEAQNRRLVQALRRLVQ